VSNDLSITFTDKTMERSIKAVEAAIEKKAINPVILQLKDISIIADFFVIVTGNSSVHNRAIADAIAIELKEDNIPLKCEGYDDASWILMDYGDIVIHIFQDSTRYYYDIEGLWGDASKVNLPSYT
jgi:ribosome-associated protein